MIKRWNFNKMKKHNTECFSKDSINQKISRIDSEEGQFNGLIEDLMEKENEVTLYKERLSELENAFYYNLEIISERDLELSLLEKQLYNETEQLQRIKQEKSELEDELNRIDTRNSKKIQELQLILDRKEEKIINLQKENAKNTSALKNLSIGEKEKESQKIQQLNMKLKFDRKKLLENYQKKIEEKNSYYLMEIKKFNEKLEEAYREKETFKKFEEENQKLKCYIANMEKLFREKESEYVQKLHQTNNIKSKIDTEVQCKLNVKGFEKGIQTKPVSINVGSQTPSTFELDDNKYKKQILFLQEQNEVLKCVIKDLKRNQNLHDKMESRSSQDKCTECTAAKLEVQALNKKFEIEIDNLKKILLDEKIQKNEEEAIIQSLETNMICLKDKLLSGLQSNVENFKGNEVYNANSRLIENNFQLAHLEKNLSEKIDLLILEAKNDRQKLNDKMEETKKEFLDKIEKIPKQNIDSIEINGDSLLEKIRIEFLKLVNKIESDVTSLIRNNCEKSMCHKDLETGNEFSSSNQFFPSETFVSSEMTFSEEEEFNLQPYEVSKMYSQSNAIEDECLSLFHFSRGEKPSLSQTDKKRIDASMIVKNFENQFMVGR